MRRDLSKEFQGGIDTIKGFKTAMTSLEVAELVGKEHKNVLADIRTETEEIGKENSKLIFQPSFYDTKYRKDLPMYNLSEMGCRQMGMRWSAKDRFTINVALENKSKPISQLDLIIQSAEALKLVTDRLEDTENKVELLDKKFDSVVTLPSCKQNEIQKAKARKVYERLSIILSYNDLPGSFQTQEEEKYKKIKSKLFSQLNRELKNKFGVASYKDIKVAEYETALKWIESWVESFDIREDI